MAEISGKIEEVNLVPSSQENSLMSSPEVEVESSDQTFIPSQKLDDRSQLSTSFPLVNNNADALNVEQTNSKSLPITDSKTQTVLQLAEAAILEKLNHSATLIPTEFAVLVADYRGKLV